MAVGHYAPPHGAKILTRKGNIMVVMVKTAKKQLMKFVGYDPDDKTCDTNSILKSFQDTFGFSLGDAVNAASEHFMLDKIVSAFKCARNSYVPNSATWEIAVQTALDTALFKGVR
jgi:L-aminopeptidase/D-esterase-like protein